MSIELKWDNIVLSLWCGCIIVNDSSVDLVTINSLFEEIDSESLYSSSFSRSYYSQSMSIDNKSIFSSNIFDNIINIRW